MNSWVILVGPTGFEPAASSSRTKRSSHLSYGPRKGSANIQKISCPDKPQTLLDAQADRSMLGRSWSLTEEENAMSKQKVVWIVFAVLVGIIAAASVWGKRCSLDRRAERITLNALIAIERVEVITLEGPPGFKYVALIFTDEEPLVVWHKMEPCEEAEDVPLVITCPSHSDTPHYFVIEERMMDTDSLPPPDFAFPVVHVLEL